MPLDSTRAKAQAAYSEADAEVKRLEAELSSAQSKAKWIGRGDEAVEKITDLPVVRENTEFLRARTDAEVAAAKAEVDRIEAELATANTRLKWARRALAAVDGINETVEDIAEAAREGLEDTGRPVGSPPPPAPPA